MLAFISNFLKRRDSIARASLYIAFFSLISRLLGLFRDRLFAAKFGAGPELDTYFAAFRIPDFVYNLLIVGAISSAFIPVFTRYIVRKKEGEAMKIADSVMNLVIILWLIFALFILVFTRPIMEKLTPGFEPWQMALTVKLTRIMLFSPLFFGISTVFGSILNSYRRFFAYALAPVLYNLGIILATVLFAERIGVFALAYGVISGAFLHMTVQFINAYLVGFRYRPILVFSPGVVRIIKLAIPRVLGLATDQINYIIQTIIGSTLLVGTIAAVNLAGNLAFLPVGLFGVALSTAVFPTLAEKASQNDKEGFINNFSKVARAILFLIIPASLIVIVLRAQIVRLILGTGHFDWQDTVMTYGILGYFAVSLFAQALIPLLARSFYALEDTKTPVKIAIISVTVNILLALYFTGKFDGLDLGPKGLALAFSLAATLQMLLLTIFLKRKLKHLDGRRIFSSTLRFFIIAAIMTLLAQWAKYLVDPLVDLSRGIGVLAQFLIVSISGILIYLILAYIFKVEEFNIIFRIFPFVRRKGLVEKRAYEEETKPPSEGVDERKGR